MKFTLYFLLLQIVCVPVYSQKNTPPLFKNLRADETNITFANVITESDTLNILNQANIYNGGGIGVADFNNDGFMDTFFAGNMVSNKLYLNAGNGKLQFTDVTDISNVSGDGNWCTGVTIVDINADGLPDVYVAASFRSDEKRRTNLLYVNQGNDPNGIPIFKEQATVFGIADTGFSTQGYFFDYDNDGDLDLYLVTNNISDPKTPIKFRQKLTDGSALNTDRLYRNNGNNTFTNVSTQAGIAIEGWGHSAAIVDFNQDGFQDIYVSNDFVSNDILYINQGNGTFKNEIAAYFKHSGWNSMGTDASDLNNDGQIDLIALEMLPESNMRKKRMLSGNEYYNYTNAQNYGFEHQYVRNVLQINSGKTSASHPVFSDRAMMSEIYHTDWSWCPLVADFDNDGLRDIIITNGLPRDVTDLDYVSYNNGQIGENKNYSLALVDSLPIVRIPNYAFKNAGNALFENKSIDWGFTEATFANGAVYADFDNDGDLDIMVNNIKGPASVYENTSTSTRLFTVSLVGNGQNRTGEGAKITMYKSDGSQLYYEHHPARGYLSSVDPRPYFGVGKDTKIDSLKIVWNGGATQLLTNVDPLKKLVLNQVNAIVAKKKSANKLPPIFEEISKKTGLDYTPVEDDFADYNVQSTLPHKLSQFGPGIAVADINNDGFEDMYIGGSCSNPGTFFTQDAAGNFTQDKNRFLQEENPLVEDMGILFFDANDDGFADLYIATGSYELPPDHPISQDRFYLNDGKGNFKRIIDALPTETANGSCVRAADFDADGDLDLFVGGRVVSAGYPSSPRSFILRNDGGKFTDVTQQVCPEVATIGMVTDALWTDYDNDGRPDLLVVGEWMPITFFKNNAGKLTKIKTSPQITNATGWWNSLTAGDFDNDGDVDYVVGNLGLNSNFKATPTQPMTILAKDLDENGSLDPMVFTYLKDENNVAKPFPMHTKDDLVTQVLSIRKKYPTYQSYGRATMDDLWSVADRTNAIQLKATEMRSSYLENKGNGQFLLTPLPVEAQTAPIYGMQTADVNNDGNLDVLLVGNDFGMEPYGGRHDAFNGLVLLGDGKGKFTKNEPAANGFFVSGDAKGFANLLSANGEMLQVVTQNQAKLRVFKNTAAKTKIVEIKPNETYAIVYLKNGQKRREEFYFGSTFLSQSTRKIKLDSSVKRFEIFSVKGVKRLIENK